MQKKKPIHHFHTLTDKKIRKRENINYHIDGYRQKKMSFILFKFNVLIIFISRATFCSLLLK
jgi:hypothetical protein